MTHPARYRLALFVAAVVLALASLACGTLGSACYSTYPGCEATAAVIRDAAQNPNW